MSPLLHKTIAQTVHLHHRNPHLQDAGPGEDSCVMGVVPLKLQVTGIPHPAADHRPARAKTPLSTKCWMLNHGF